MTEILSLPETSSRRRPAALRGKALPMAQLVRPKLPRQRPLTIGFVRLVDIAPLVAANEMGLFQRHGLIVKLSREIGWAALRHRATFDGLDVMHAPGPMPLAVTLGLGGPARPCVAGLVLNLHGNAVTLGKKLREEGVTDGPSLATHVFSHRRREPLVLAVVSRHSSHQYLLAKWLRQHGLDAKRDVRLVVLSPDQLVRNLAAGHIDGFCAGEPWNSLAVAEAGGWCPATSLELDRGHAEKVLMATEDFITRRPDEFTALAAAVLEACGWCDTAEGRLRLPVMLAARKYLDLPADIIARSLQGPFDRGGGRREAESNFIVFHRFRANEPTPEKALWMLECLAQAETLPLPEKQLRATAVNVFRSDLFHAAERQMEAGKK